MARRYSRISSDSHLEVPTERWMHHIPKEHRDRAPRRISLANGGDAWLVEGHPLRICGLELSGRGYEELRPTGVTYEGSPGTGSPEQRLAEQDRDGVDAEVLFTGVGGPNFWRGVQNDESYRAIVHGYNTYLVEEYCAAAPDRLLGMGAIPETGLDDALRELRYCAQGGLKGVVLNAFPNGSLVPLPEDDRFWAETLETGVAVTVHVGLRFLGGRKGPSFSYANKPVDVGFGASDPVKRIASWGMLSGLNATQLMFAGVFDRFPDFRIFFAETQAGWVPNFLEFIDDLYDRNIHWAHALCGLPKLERRPSEYIQDHVLWGITRNRTGVRYRHDIGVGNILWSNDFPHGDSDWPRSDEVIDHLFHDVPDEETQAMVAGNAVAFFRLDSDQP